jgi:hypothetical protein
VGKVRRGNYVFITWKGDHAPRHVHVYRDGAIVVTWDLERWRAIRGSASSRLRRILRTLVAEGAL